MLRLPYNLAHVHADECRWRVRHVTERIEHRFRCSCMFFGIEEPERMLDKIATFQYLCPITTRRACHALNHSNAAAADHCQRFVLVSWMDGDSPDDCVHRCPF